MSVTPHTAFKPALPSLCHGSQPQKNKSTSRQKLLFYWKYNLSIKKKNLNQTSVFYFMNMTKRYFFCLSSIFMLYDCMTNHFFLLHVSLEKAIRLLLTRLESNRYQKQVPFYFSCNAEIFLKKDNNALGKPQ
jgi:hypothetical protein